MRREELLSTVKQTVLSFVPDAEIHLYGSRARGDSKPDSDWDFLVLSTKRLTSEEQDKIRHALYEIEWDVGEVLCSIFQTKKEFQAQTIPLFENVAKEGIVL